MNFRLWFVVACVTYTHTVQCLQNCSTFLDSMLILLLSLPFLLIHVVLKRSYFYYYFWNRTYNSANTDYLSSNRLRFRHDQIATHHSNYPHRLMYFLLLTRTVISESTSFCQMRMGDEWKHITILNTEMKLKTVLSNPLTIATGPGIRPTTPLISKLCSNPTIPAHEREW